MNLIFVNIGHSMRQWYNVATLTFDYCMLGLLKVIQNYRPVLKFILKLEIAVFSYMENKRSVAVNSTLQFLSVQLLRPLVFYYFYCIIFYFNRIYNFSVKFIWLMLKSLNIGSSKKLKKKFILKKKTGLLFLYCIW